MDETEELKKALLKGSIQVKGIEEDRKVDMLSEVEITEKDRLAIEAGPKKPSALNIFGKIKSKFKGG